MKDYMTSQGCPIVEETFYLATRWSDPERDVRVARELALDLLFSRHCDYEWEKRDRFLSLFPPLRFRGSRFVTIDLSPFFPFPGGERRISEPCNEGQVKYQASKEAKRGRFAYQI
jgi:hypothetical protein